MGLQNEKENTTQHKLTINPSTQDPEYLLIKRWVPEAEQDKFWADTRELRERRMRDSRPLMIEETTKEHWVFLEKEKDKKKHGHRGRETEMLMVRPAKKDRRHSHSREPPPLLRFMAGQR